jgi:hypothetical protein
VAESPPRPASRRVDATRVLLWVYGLFVVAAGSRSAVQLLTHPGRAPLAYLLSALAALVYAAGFLLIWRASRGAPRSPAVTCALAELTGVLAVGTASVVHPAAFPDASVWSWFGAGYLGVPLVLPVLVLLWARTGISRTGPGPGDRPEPGPVQGREIDQTS